LISVFRLGKQKSKKNSGWLAVRYCTFLIIRKKTPHFSRTTVIEY
jgi:hypothetical protein